MPTGKVTTYDLTTGVKLDIESMIHVLSPFDTPLLGQYGADGKSALAKGTCTEKKVEWLDETLLTPRSVTAATATTGELVLTIATGQQLRFSTGDVVRIGAENIRITGYGTTADTYLITRAFGGSAATVANGAAIVGVGRALPEGSDPENARSLDRTARYNMTEIFGPEAVQVSSTENVVKKYGTEGTTEFQYQVANRMKELAVGIEQALMYGIRVEDTSNKIRAMGGLDYYITTNNNTSVTQLLEANLLTGLQTAFDAGGSPDRAVVGATQKRVISAWATGVQIRVDRADNGRGQIVDYFDSDFGRVSVLLNRWARTSDLFLFNRDQAEVCTLRPIVFEPLAKTGDSVKGQIVGEKTFKFRREAHAYKFTALT